MNRQGAFTLIELAVTVALLSLVATIAVPALTDVIERNRQQAVMNQLQSLLQDARSRAVMNGKIVELCPSADGVNCVNDWTQPWLQRRLSDAQVYSHIAPAASNGPLHWQVSRKASAFTAMAPAPLVADVFSNAIATRSPGSSSSADREGYDLPAKAKTQRTLDAVTDAACDASPNTPTDRPQSIAGHHLGTVIPTSSSQYLRANSIGADHVALQ